MATVDNNIEVNQTPMVFWFENEFYSTQHKRVHNMEEFIRTIKEENVSGIRIIGNTVEVLFTL